MSNIDWLASHHSVENIQLQLATRAWKLCTRRLFRMKGVLHLLAWVFQSRFESCKFHDYSVVVMLYDHNIVISGSVSFTLIIDYYNSVQYEATQSLPGPF